MKRLLGVFIALLLLAAPAAAQNAGDGGLSSAQALGHGQDAGFSQHYATGGIAPTVCSPNLTTGLSPVNVTITTGQPDPTGGTSGISMIETTADAIHQNEQDITITANETLTVEAMVKQDVGTRNLQLYVLDTSSYSNEFFQAWNPSSGAIVSGGGGQTGDGVLQSYGSAPILNKPGWYKVWATGSVGGGLTGIQVGFVLLEGTFGTYTGDGVSGVYLYGTATCAGSSP